MAARTQLHLLRHADAGDPEAWHRPDAERPLSAKGRAQAKAIAGHLRAIGFAPDTVLTSPKVRAVETAEPVADALGVRVSVDDRLAGGMGLQDLAAVLTDAGEPRRPVLVGHDPDFSWLSSELVGTEVSLKKGALIRIDLDGPPAPGAGRLRWLIPPELLAEPG
jgi:phosphohistidine phosphatase SixA